MTDDCCYHNLKDAKWVSRAKWVCPVCGKDVSLEFVMLHEAKVAVYRRDTSDDDNDDNDVDNCGENFGDR